MENETKKAAPKKVTEPVPEGMIKVTVIVPKEHEQYIKDRAERLRNSK